MSINDQIRRLRASHRSNDHGTGFGTPEMLSSVARADGHNFGASRIAEEKALGPDAAPRVFITGTIGYRKGVVTREALRDRIAAGKLRAAAGARTAEARANVRILRERIARLQETLVKPRQAAVVTARVRAAECKQTFETARAEFLAMPRACRGYFRAYSSVAFVGIAVVLFDGGVLHGILESSGMSTLSAWLTSVTVPLAIGAANHGFGVLAGAIGARMPRQGHLKMALALFVAGLGSIAISFLLLTVFRMEAANSQNDALAALARGEAGTQLTFFISPIWMGPLQIAGSFAAITMTALWTIAREGREFRALVVDPAESDWHRAEIDLVGAERELDDAAQLIEETCREHDAAALLEHQIAAESDAAQVEIDTADDLLSAALAEEDSLATAMQARYETTEQYFDQIYKNGGVWRMAMATVFPRLGRPYTPGATDTAADDDLIAERHAQREPRGRGPFRRGRRTADPSSNGHSDGPIDLDLLKRN